MLKRIAFLFSLVVLISFTACNKEGDEPNPNNSTNLIEVEINGEIVVVDMTPPPASTKVHWVHIGYTREPDGTVRSVWEDLHAHPESTCRYAVYVGNRGFRCESRKPPML